VNAGADLPASTDVAGVDPGEVECLAEARAAVLERIAAACARAGRDAADVTLVAVSKTVPADRVRAAVAAGLTTLGENRVQEAAAKIPAVPGARWHLVGPLQSNKARRAIELFDVIEAVDSVDLAVRLDRLVRAVRGLPPEGAVDPGRRLPVFVQVNVDRDPAKAGMPPDAVAGALTAIAALGAIRVEGLMTIGRLAASVEEARRTFVALRDLSVASHRDASTLGPALSMGMTDDFEVAVEEGATHVRVGRALFGDRPPVE
jgi:pyridoxal phosphate enzyme (YggS family)